MSLRGTKQSRTMHGGYYKLVCGLLLLCFFSCHSAPQSLIYIKLADSDKAIAINGINEAILNDINRDSIKNWESLIAVYKMPADTDMKDYQPVQPGRYAVKNGALLFTPDTAFVKQQAYFARYYNYADNKTLWDYLAGKTSKGQLHYTDLIFKP